MSDISQADDRAGWELLFRSGNFPPRYQSQAAPNPSVVEWADALPPGSSILDVGCGVGRHLLYLGARGFRMAGADISPTGVKTSQERCAEQQIALDARVSPMTLLPWGDNVFDAALSTSTIPHNRRADILRTLQEVRRVLKPGGLFLVDFLHKDTLNYQRALDQAASGQLTEVEPDTFIDESPTLDASDDAFLPHHFSDEAEVRNLLGSFDIVRLWADLSERAPDGGRGQRGYWVAWARKPLSS